MLELLDIRATIHSSPTTTGSKYLILDHHVWRLNIEPRTVEYCGVDDEDLSLGDTSPFILPTGNVGHYDMDLDSALRAEGFEKASYKAVSGMLHLTYRVRCRPSKAINPSALLGQ